jgi:hypothetical protein
LRHRLDELRADAHMVASAPMPSAAAKAIMVRQIENLAQAGRPAVLHCVEIGHEISFATRIERIGPVAVQQTDVVGLVAWLLKPQLIAALAAEIDDLADDGAALTDAQRSAKEREIAAAALDTERQIEAVIEAAEAQGTAIARAESADPRAVLNIV